MCLAIDIAWLQQYVITRLPLARANKRFLISFIICEFTPNQANDCTDVVCMDHVFTSLYNTHAQDVFGSLQIVFVEFGVSSCVPLDLGCMTHCV